MGPIGDIVHVATGTAGYPHAAFWGLAWWVPLLFGGAAVVVAYSHVSTDTIIRSHQALPRTYFDIILSLISFLTIYCASGVLPFGNFEKFLILMVMALATWYIFEGTLPGLFQALVTSVAGCTVEALIIASENFYYTEPDVWGIPLWLGWLYVAASVSVGNLGRKLSL